MGGKVMALIQCPNCGKEVSDKAEKCPNCETLLREPPKKVCKECGQELNEGVLICHKCGCPVSTETSERGSKKKGSKKLIIIAVLIIVALLIIIFGVNSYNKKVEENKKIEISENYGINIKTATTTMLKGASDAEKLGVLIHDVWSNTIFEKSDAETDMYTKTDGRFNNDFNDSLNKLFADSTYQTRLSAVKSNQTNVERIMKKLQDPPEEYQEAYNAIKDYYDAYLEIINLVINPSGNLQTFTSNFNDADSAVVKYYAAMKIYTE